MNTSIFRILISASAFIAMHSASAQFFIEAHGGYLGRIGGDTFSSFDESTNDYTRHVYNMGQGAGGGVALGYGFSDMVGAEARFSYVSGRKLEVESTFASSSSSRKNVETHKSNFLRIEPAIRLTVGAGNARIYAAAGPSIALAPKYQFDFEYNTTYTNASFPGMPISELYNGTIEFSGGMGLGGFGAVGFQYQGEGAIGFFAELNATAQSWAPNEVRLTSETRTQYFGGTSISESESETTDLVNVRDADDDNKGLKNQLPMSTWGLRVGLHVRFGSRD